MCKLLTSYRQIVARSCLHLFPLRLTFRWQSLHGANNLENQYLIPAIVPEWVCRSFTIETEAETFLVFIIQYCIRVQTISLSATYMEYHLKVAMNNF